METEEIQNKRNYKHYSEEERKAIVLEVDRLMSEEGMARRAACKQMGVAVGSFSFWKTGKTYGKKAAPKKGKHAVVLHEPLNPGGGPLPMSGVMPIPTSLMIPDREDEVMCFIGKPGSIVSTIRKLYGDKH